VGFRDLNLQRRYSGQAGELAREFYIPVLSEARLYDRQAGYFDSATLVQVAAGLASFIRHVLEDSYPQAAGRPAIRLIAGASWREADVKAFHAGHEIFMQNLGQNLSGKFEPTDEECLRLGLPPGWRPEEDQIAAHRLATLAWLAARGLLEIKVALPVNEQGQPYRPGGEGALFHPKVGILTDKDGDMICFQGSVNETGAAWARNREKFQVARSWYSEQDREDIRVESEEFERLWHNREPGLLVVPLPEAARARLLKFLPDEPPTVDVLDPDFGKIPLDVRLQAQFLLDAPRLPGGRHLVLVPLKLKPYPHQMKVADRAEREFPRRFLFCDEVGLGKTIEAGLALRQLLLAGAVFRVLIIAPKGLIRQWQEELREKFALTAWYYDGRMLKDVGGRTHTCANPWDNDGITIVSLQFVSRQNRLPELVSARPWDLLIVDEAHRARRKTVKEPAPNQFLFLLREMAAREKFKGLWLLTATPMQLDPVEVHDLLKLCGVHGPQWGEWVAATRFEEFFLGLGKFARDVAVREKVMEMVQVAVRQGARGLPPTPVPAEWTNLRWQRFVEMVNLKQPGLALEIHSMTPAQAESILPYLERQTPLAVHMFRYTRETLRVYWEKGLMSRSIPARLPEDVPVTFGTSLEQEMYERIDVLCRHFYRLAELEPEERSAIGYLMAVFRKRLASSFYALAESLQRRLDFLADLERGELAPELRARLIAEGAEEEDEEDEDTGFYIQKEQRRVKLLPPDRIRTEQEFIQRYINDLRQAQEKDSKFTLFRKTIERLIQEGHRVIVFTQYLDTLTFLKDRLVPYYGDGLACYSGRGGEVFDPARNQWTVVEKAVVKERARRDHPRAVKLLLCTDAASEGINLQQFSALINYDLPWNPMRVEQRIGRIDRIGQEAPAVRIINLYVSGTIEHDAYRVLKTRIGFFHRVVGPLQPILATMPQIMRMVATGELERAEALRMIEEAAGEKLGLSMQPLERFVDTEEPGETGESAYPQQSVPATQAELAAWCLRHRPAGMCLTPCPEPGQNNLAPDPARGCFLLRWAGAPEHLGISPADEVRVTFNPDVADRHPPTAPQSDPDGLDNPRGSEGVRYLTWGDPLLEAWLAAVRGEKLADEELRQLGIKIEREQKEDGVRLSWQHESGAIKNLAHLVSVSMNFR